MRWVVISIIMFIGYILQTTIIPSFELWGVFPNLILVLICCFAFLGGSKDGIITGVSLGLLSDLAYGRAIGLYTLLGLYLGVFAGKFNKRFFKDNYLVALVFMIVCTFVYEGIIYIFSVLIYNGDFHVITAFVKIAIEAFLNAIVAVIVYPILLKLNLNFEVNRKIFGRVR